MWDVISQISTREAQCSVILTTHSMEEAEALCTRIGVSEYSRRSLRPPVRLPLCPLVWLLY